MNQSLYSGLFIIPDKKLVQDKLFHFLENSDGFSYAKPSHIALLQKTFLNEDWMLAHAKEATLKTSHLPKNNDDEEQLLQYIVTKALQRCGDTIWETPKQLNVPLLKEAYLAEVKLFFEAHPESNIRKTLFGDIHYAIALNEACARLELKHKTVQTEPKLVRIIFNLIPDIQFETYAKTKNLQVKYDFELGLKPYYLVKDDNAYCEQFSKLPAGFYRIRLRKPFGHVISFIKEENGSGYIVDPNNIRLRFANDEEAKRLLRGVLAYYPLPNADDPHEVQIAKIEKASAKSA